LFQTTTIRRKKHKRSKEERNTTEYTEKVRLVTISLENSQYSSTIYLAIGGQTWRNSGSNYTLFYLFEIFFS